MADEQEAAALAGEAAPESVDTNQGVETPEQQPEAEAAPETPQSNGGETEGGEEKTASQKRRERRKREKERRLLRDQPDYQSQVAALEGVLSKEAPADPNPDDYENPDVYQADLAYSRGQKKTLEEAKKEAKERLKALGNQANDDVRGLWNKTVREGRKKYPDFVEATHPDNWSLSKQMLEMIVTSDNGADVAYYLATNPDEAADIYDMAAAGQARALVEIEAMVSSPEPKTESSAPPPINPVKPKANPPVSLSELAKKQDATEYMRMRNAELEKGL